MNKNVELGTDHKPRNVATSCSEIVLPRYFGIEKVLLSCRQGSRLEHEESEYHNL